MSELKTTTELRARWRTSGFGDAKDAADDIDNLLARINQLEVDASAMGGKLLRAELCEALDERNALKTALEQIIRQGEQDDPCAVVKVARAALDALAKGKS